MEKTRAISNNKKCLCCGKLYPSDTDQKRCTCEQKGWLSQLEHGTSRRSKANIDIREVIVWKKKQRSY